MLFKNSKHQLKSIKSRNNLKAVFFCFLGQNLRKLIIKNASFNKLYKVYDNPKTRHKYLFIVTNFESIKPVEYFLRNEIRVNLCHLV